MKPCWLTKSRILLRKQQRLGKTQLNVVARSNSWELLRRDMLLENNMSADQEVFAIRYLH